MGRQLLLLALAFGGGTLIALALGAKNLGTSASRRCSSSS
jgi:hypothetical protein